MGGAVAAYPHGLRLAAVRTQQPKLPSRQSVYMYLGRACPGEEGCQREGKHGRCDPDEALLPNVTGKHDSTSHGMSWSARVSGINASVNQPTEYPSVLCEGLLKVTAPSHYSGLQ